MVTSLLSPPSAPTPATLRSPFLRVSKLSFASRRCRLLLTMASAEDPINKKPTNDDKKSFKTLYGLHPKQLNMFISSQKYAAKQPESITEDIAQLDNFVHRSGMAIKSRMRDGLPPKYIMKKAGFTEPFPPTSRGLGRVRYKGRPMPQAPDLMSHFFMKRIIFMEDISREETEHIIAQLWWLDKYQRKPIYMYLFSEGEHEEECEYDKENDPAYVGPNLDGVAIASFMMTRKSEIITVNMGMADAVAALLLSLGVKGRRGVYPHALITLSLPEVYRSKTRRATDIWSTGKVLDSTLEIYLELLSKGTGKPMMELYRDLQRPKVFTAQEAIDYGLADKIVAPGSLPGPAKKKSPVASGKQVAARLDQLAKFQAKSSP